MLFNSADARQTAAFADTQELLCRVFIVDSHFKDLPMHQTMPSRVGAAEVHLGRCWSTRKHACYRIAHGLRGCALARVYACGTGTVFAGPCSRPANNPRQGMAMHLHQFFHAATCRCVCGLAWVRVWV